MLSEAIYEEDFYEEAACADGTGALVDLFFSESIPDIIEAKAICRSCVVREACVEGALARREPWGVWGGELFVNGRILPKKRPRGRPPKYREQLTA
jgi:WhiB family redox-sensing transcriptional regulator